MTDTREMTGSKIQALENARRLIQTGAFVGAEQQARAILEQDPSCVSSHFILAIALRRTGRQHDAEVTQEKALELAPLQPAIFEAAMALAENRLDHAERLLREQLEAQPENAVAMRMLAEIGARTGNFDFAERILLSALEVVPGYKVAESLLQAIGQARLLQESRLENRKDRATLVVDDEKLRLMLAPSQSFEEALKLYEKAVEMRPSAPQNWVSYGHVLRTIGRRADAVAAYRRAIQENAQFGDAWWALADLKTAQFDDADIETMNRLVGQNDLGTAEMASIHFALGKALEERGEFELSFFNYQEGNRLKAQDEPHDRLAVKRHVDRSIALFTADYFDARIGSGMQSSDPIFILGMPRAGSTLLEQILATHSEVEATMELPDISKIARLLANGAEPGMEESGYLERVASLERPEIERLGKAYIWGSGLRRTTGRPFFVDKMPNNWLHIGLILTILPNAKIIDARRHPLACGFSNFKQHFARGQGFTYDLRDIGSFYVDYVRMMRHFDELMPGRIHRVFHERLVNDPETEIRALMSYLELDYEPACLNFHETKRVVRTSSSEQVRQPLNQAGLDQWRSFEPWLGKLKDSLGALVEAYPGLPANLKR